MSNQTIIDLEQKVSLLERKISHLQELLNVDDSAYELYEFIEDETVRKVLALDYINMEKTSVFEFEKYCQYAFFQIENLTNYHILKKYMSIPNDFNTEFSSDITAIKTKINNFDSLSLKDKIMNIPFDSKLGRLSLDILEYSVYEDYLSLKASNPNTPEPTKDQYKKFWLKWNSITIKKVRNSFLHRDSTNQTEKILNFIKKRDHKLVRECIHGLVENIKNSQTFNSP